MNHLMKLRALPEVSQRLVASWLPLRQRLRAYVAASRDFRLRHAHWFLVPCCIPTLVVLYKLLPVVWSRLRYPMDIEWTEGGGLLQADRVLHGLPLYPEPLHQFMPYPYPPLHSYVMAAAGSVFGVNFTMGRAVSCVAVVVATGLLAREVYRAWHGTHLPWVWSLLAVGMIAVGYRLCGGYYDLIRCDSLTLCFAVAGAVAAEWFVQSPSWRRGVACGALCLATVFTKQTSMSYVAWILLYVVLSKPRSGLRFAVGFTLALGACIGIAEWSSGGNFLHYTVWGVSKHHVVEGGLRRGFRKLLDFAPFLPLLLPATLLLLWKEQLTRRALLWVGMAATALPAGLLPLAKVGGYINNYIGPAFLVGPAALCVAAAAFAPRSPRARSIPVELILFASLCATYVHAHEFPIARYVITAEEQAGAAQLKSWVKQFGDRALIPRHPFLALETGTTLEQSQIMPWYDALWSQADPSSFERYVKRSGADHLLFTGDEPDFARVPAAKHFALAAVLPDGAYSKVMMSDLSPPRYSLKRTRAKRSAKRVFDFEDGKLEGWTSSGKLPKLVKRKPHQFIGAEGRYLLNTYEDGGDGATLTLTSPPFTLDRPLLSLRVGGGSKPTLKVELLVNGRSRRTATGLNADMLQDVVWDVAEFSGGSAQLRVVDEERGGWGHIQLDSVYLEDRRPERHAQ